MYGMDAGELSRRNVEIGKTAGPLADELYAALEDRVPGQVCDELIVRAKACIAMHDGFLAVLRGVQCDGVERGHKGAMDDVRKFLAELEGSE